MSDESLLCLIDLAKPQELNISIPYEKLRRASYLELRFRGKAMPYQIKEAFLLLDAQKVALHFKDGKAMLKIPADLRGNNGCSLTLRMENVTKAKAIIELLLN